MVQPFAFSPSSPGGNRTSVFRDSESAFQNFESVLQKFESAFQDFETPIQKQSILLASLVIAETRLEEVDVLVDVLVVGV